MKKTYFILFLLLFFQIPTLSSHVYLEKDYQKFWCSSHQGQIEYKLPDSSRIDCLTSEYAIEFDFASKWAESVGQSLYYAQCTHKKPAIVLIMENPNKDSRYLKRLETLANAYNIKVWTMGPNDISPILTNVTNK